MKSFLIVALVDNLYFRRKYYSFILYLLFSNMILCWITSWLFLLAWCSQKGRNSTFFKKPVGIGLTKCCYALTLKQLQLWWFSGHILQIMFIVDLPYSRSSCNISAPSILLQIVSKPEQVILSCLPFFCYLFSRKGLGVAYM